MSDHRPTPERFLDLLQGYQRTQVLRAALELDLFSAIGRGVTDVASLAAALGASPRGIRILADYLVTVGLLTKSADRYELAADSALYLDRRSPEFLGDAARFLAAPWLLESFDHAAEAVRTGGSGRALDSMAREHPIWVEYARVMGPLFRVPGAAIADHLARTPLPVRRVLDIAAGHGVFGAEIAARFPQAELTALDWPSVLPIARSRAATAGLADRFVGLPGDVFTTPFGADFDVVVLANFLHHFDPPTCIALLERVRAALVSGGRVVLVEFVPNPDRVAPASVAQFAMTMLATTRLGDAYPYEELEAMLGSAGFAGVERLRLPGSPQRALLASAPAPGTPRTAFKNP